MSFVYETSADEKAIRSNFNHGEIDKLPLRKIDNFTIFNQKSKKPTSIEKLNNCILAGKLQSSKKNETILVETDQIVEKRINFKEKTIYILTEEAIYQLMNPSIAYLHLFRPKYLKKNHFNLILDSFKFYLNFGQF
jgi:hypothetical protein